MKIILIMCLATFLSLTGAASTAQQAAARSKEKDEAGVIEREQYQDKIEAKLRQLDNEIAALNVKMRKQGKWAGKQLDQQMAELEQKREAAGQQFQKLKNSSQDAWQDMRVGIDAAVKDLQAAYTRIAARFN
jgi:peptidoglycan hydrolase CwlO-like protein